MTWPDLDLAKGWFEGYWPWAGPFARVVLLARSGMSIPAGVLKMPLWDGRSGNKEFTVHHCPPTVISTISSRMSTVSDFHLRAAYEGMA